MLKSTANICIEDMAASLGITTKELVASIDRLVCQGWLRPPGNGTYQLTTPGNDPA